MKLEKVLDQLNAFEKNAFLKILDNIITNSPRNATEVEKTLSDKYKDIKSADNINISKVFEFVEIEFTEYIRSEFNDIISQLDVVTDILIRDGNCIMKLDWFSRLYEKELFKLEKKIKDFNVLIENDSDDLIFQRRRDYIVYKECLQTAYCNDRENNQEERITRNELSILLTLSKRLELSQEEVKLINYSIIPLKRTDVDSLISSLRNKGVLFFSKKNNTIYIPDEVVRVLRKVRRKELADKFFRRILLLLREPQINLVCKKHGINWREPVKSKIKSIINEGISFRTVLAQDIFKEEEKVLERKKFLIDFCDRDLRISPSLRGATIDDKLNNMVSYFEDIEKDEKVGISVEGYDKLLREIEGILPNLNSAVKEEFELQEENTLLCDLLLDYNIKPRDILEIIDGKELESFCTARNIKTRGDIISNILEEYKDAENLYLENYVNIGFRNFNALKENGIHLKEVDLGVKFEEITKSIFSKLGFLVDEQTRRQINTKNDKIDIVLNLGSNELIIVECKSIKESGFNKFSSVSRQLKAYIELAKKNHFNVVKSLLIAPEFSDDFINECGLEYELNLSLITADSLRKILEGFKESRMKQFPYKLLFRDVLIQEDRILKAIEK